MNQLQNSSTPSFSSTHCGVGFVESDRATKLSLQLASKSSIFLGTGILQPSFMFVWDPNPDLVNVPILNWPIKWYGLLFAFGFAVGFLLFKSLLLRYFSEQGTVSNDPDTLKQTALKITDKMTLYVVIATIIGARLGHFLFYERPSSYLFDPLEIFRIREGGLSSHGGAIAIIFALWLFSRWSKTIEPGLTWLRLLDFISIPTAFAGACIRIGNFFNQEILGTPSQLPWAVLFLHPADRGALVPRHPVQLYEAAFYLLVFVLLWAMSHRRSLLLTKGKLFGWFLVLVFGFRLYIESFKLEQSRLFLGTEWLTMGQILSIPLVLLGVVLLFWPRNLRSS